MTVEQMINQLMDLNPKSIVYASQDDDYGIAKMVSEVSYNDERKSNVIIECYPDKYLVVEEEGE